MIYPLLQLLLPIVGWLGCYGLCRELTARDRIEKDWRLSLLLATTAWGALLTFLTELCSLGHVLNRTALVATWVFVDGVLWTGRAWLARKRNASPGTAMAGLLAEWRFISKFAAWPLELRLMLLAVVLLVLFLGGVALLTPTANWDSLTYHL